jgi:imidazolonepropionase
MTEIVDLLLVNAAQVVTCAGPGPKRGAALADAGVIERGAVAVDDGRIAAVGPTAELQSRFRSRVHMDVAGKIICPGFVDCHTHLVFAGDRVDEFERKLAGASYQELLAAGGGILSTMRSTRAASLDELVALGRRRLYAMARLGTTTVEIKSGYGLDTAGELKILAAIEQLAAAAPQDIVPTFLGAHALPPEFTGDPDGYIALVCEEMLPAVAAWRNASLFNALGVPVFNDVFCEQGVFDLAQSRRVLEAGLKIGLRPKIHADEFVSLGGARLAAELDAISADHLVKTPPEDIRALAASETVAVALPCTPFGLAQPEYTPARAILEAGGLLALATDLNPGTAWCESMPFVIALACRYLKLTPAEAIAAATINAAAAIGAADRLGSLEPGKQADLIVLDVPDYRHLGYRFGTNPVLRVMKRGRWVV